MGVQHERCLGCLWPSGVLMGCADGWFMDMWLADEHASHTPRRGLSCKGADPARLDRQTQDRQTDSIFSSLRGCEGFARHRPIPIPINQGKGNRTIIWLDEDIFPDHLISMLCLGLELNCIVVDVHFRCGVASKAGLSAEQPEKCFLSRSLPGTRIADDIKGSRGHKFVFLGALKTKSRVKHFLSRPIL